MRANRHAEFILENSQIMAIGGAGAFESAKQNYVGTPQDGFALIQASPQAEVSSETPVLRVTLRNNLFFETLGPARNVTSGRVRPGTT